MREFERTFDSLYEGMQDLSFAGVRNWNEQHPGAKAVAFFPVYDPMELVHAAGMLPALLSGAGDRLDIQHADSRFGSFICSIIKTTMEMAMNGHLEPFDGLLFPLSVTLPETSVSWSNATSRRCMWIFCICRTALQ